MQDEDPTWAGISLPTISYSDPVAVLQQHHEKDFKRILPVDIQDNSPLSPTTSGTEPTPEEALLSASPVLETSQHVINQRRLTIDQASELLQSFRDMTNFFPFVVVPPDATVQLISKDSPFLLLAILTAASGADMQLQYQLDHEFKKILSSKVVVEGQRNLDFLQGLLVYIAW